MGRARLLTKVETQHVSVQQNITVSFVIKRGTSNVDSPTTFCLTRGVQFNMDRELLETCTLRTNKKMTQKASATKVVPSQVLAVVNGTDFTVPLAMRYRSQSQVVVIAAQIIPGGCRVGKKPELRQSTMTSPARIPTRPLAL